MFLSDNSARRTVLKSFRFTLPQITQRRVLVHGFYSGSESPSDDDTEKESKRFESKEPLVFPLDTREVWYISKAAKFLRCSEPSSCIAALLYLSNCDFQNRMNLETLMTGDALEIMVNLTEVNYPDVVAAALIALRTISKQKKVVQKLIDFGLCHNLVENLRYPRHERNSIACEVIANIGRIRLAARNIRKWDGIRKIVGLLNVEKQTLLAPESALSADEKVDIHLTHCAAQALWSLSKFTKNKKEVQKAGVIPIMTDLILSGNTTVSLPMTGMLCECSSEFFFQLAIQSDGLVGVLLQDMMSDDEDLNYLCANALANAADHHEMVSHIIRHCGGLRMVIDTLKVSDQQNIPLISALLRLLWKSANNMENVKKYHSLGAVSIIVSFIDSQEIKLRVPATGALAELAKFEPCRRALTELGVIETLVNNFGSPNTQLLCNTIHSIGQLVKSPKAMKIVQNMNVICRIWSLLKNKQVEVQIEALNSLLPIVEEADNSAELIRSLDGSLHLLVNTLRFGQEELIGSACLLVAEVARDLENLKVMTDYGLLEVLTPLIKKEGEILKEADETINSRDVKDILKLYGNLDTFVDDDPKGVRQALAKAVAMCSTTPENSLEFGISGTIETLVLFLKSKKAALRTEASHALWELSRIELNCLQMHMCGAVTPLLNITGHNDQPAQIAAAGVLSNMRRLLVANDISMFCIDPSSPPLRREKVIPVK